jgi:heme-degrading protein
LYAGSPDNFGTAQDPMVGKPIGGTIVFGGGLALYDGNGITGALGVSGDSSCADHNVAWRVRHQLGLDRVPAGVSPNMKDAIIYDIGPDGKSPSGFGHPKCNGKEDQIAVDLGAGVSGNVVR